ncbi:phage tail protein [Vibrio tetraodonis]|uniref:phage tail-collar fiber domain-containing protein n=1 Tax=Vibrio tetraodonis TaxID=2231647 RepID=UPI000E0B150E|nr:phage tail protein [Vibrio tetraodonis]
MTLAVTITEQGLAECVNKKTKGIHAEIKWISVGDRDYTPSATQTSLRNEKQRVEISEYRDTGEASLQCTAKFSGDSEFAIREIGIWLSSGTLLGVISEKDKTLNYKATNAHVIIPFTMDLSALPTDSVKVNVGVENLNILIDEDFAALSASVVNNQAQSLKQELRMLESEKQRDEFAGQVNQTLENQTTHLRSLDSQIERFQGRINTEFTALSTSLVSVQTNDIQQQLDLLAANKEYNQFTGQMREQLESHSTKLESIIADLDRSREQLSNDFTSLAEGHVSTQLSVIKQELRLNALESRIK